MKCRIIQDLLPLYCDKLTSQESNEEIEKHLHDCGECAEIYEKMCTKETPINPEDKDIQPLKKVKKKNIIKIIAAALSTAVLLGTVFLFVFWGVIPISSDKLKMELSTEISSTTSWSIDENGNPTDMNTREYEALTILFIGDCSTTNEKTDISYIYNEDGSITSHHEITVYPVIRLPFEDIGEYPNQFELTVPVNELDTITIHYSDKTEVYTITELAEMAEKNDN